MLDGAEHRHRKAMFVSLMAPASVERLTDEAEQRWRARFEAWERTDRIVLLHEAEEVLCRAACRWAGVPLAEDEARDRTRERAAMVAGAGAAGPRNWRALVLRGRTERWMRAIVERLRSGALVAPEGSPADVVVRRHRDLDGRELDTRIAAVELLNLLRPTVAVAGYVTFAAQALHAHPKCRERLKVGNDECREWFVQEVRRFYPFFPAIARRPRA